MKDKTDVADDSIVVDRGLFEMLLNSIANLKYIDEVAPETRKAWLYVIDNIWNQGMKALNEAPAVTEGRIAYNMEFLNLTERQVEIHDIIMQSKMNTWPDSLVNLIKERSQKLGCCSELIVSCVADWIANRDRANT